MTALDRDAGRAAGFAGDGAAAVHTRDWAVVTGASSGIGTSLARVLAQRGHDLLLVARRGDVLDGLARELHAAHGVAIEVRAVDLVDPAARGELAGELRTLRVGLLCNNAGVASFGPLAGLAADGERDQLTLNTVAVHDLTLAVLPGMLARRRGGILFSGSVAGNLPIPNNATYAATKAFVNSFAEALHHELAGTGVSVTLLAPGPVRAGTAVPAVAGSGRSGPDAVDRAVPGLLWTSADDAARHALDALARNRLRVVPGATGKGLSLVTRHGPRRLLSPLAGRLYRRLAT